MNLLREGVQISLISISIVFASLLVFNVLLSLMGNFFQRVGHSRIAEREGQSSFHTIQKITADQRKITAIMAVIREEIGDHKAEIKIIPQRKGEG